MSRSPSPTRSDSEGGGATVRASSCSPTYGCLRALVRVDEQPAMRASMSDSIRSSRGDLERLGTAGASPRSCCPRSEGLAPRPDYSRARSRSELGAHFPPSRAWSSWHGFCQGLGRLNADPSGYLTGRALVDREETLYRLARAVATTEGAYRLADKYRDATATSGPGSCLSQRARTSDLGRRRHPQAIGRPARTPSLGPSS